MPSFDRDAALKRAEKALRQGRIDAAIAEYLRVTEADPRDWTCARVLGDLHARAGQIDRALAQYARTADQLAAEGLVDEAVSLFRHGLKLKPNDDYAAMRLRQLEPLEGTALFSPDGGAPPAAAGAVREFLPVAAGQEDESTDEDYRSPWFTMAEIALREGKLEEGRQAVAEALQFDPGSKEVALQMAYRVAAMNPDAGYQVVDALVDRSLDENDYAAAATALQEFVTRAPNHLIALMHLVDVAMEGGLESTMYDAQAQLADAYLNEGRGLEARIIAEDLVAREPWNRANIERFRNALTLLGERDPDAVIAGRLSGESPFLATDLVGFEPQDEGDDGIEVFDGSASVNLTETGGSSSQAEGPRDNTDVAAGVRTEERVPAAAVVAPHAQPVPASRTGGEDRAAAQYRLGLTYRDLGMLDDAVRALEGATASERLRFSAAAILARMHRARGHSSPALEWLDRAARWAPPATDIGRAVRYDLGEVLEEVGDHDRALAVFTGLESEQVGYRDVPARIQRLLSGRAPDV
jgi:tetratricopeptide (TPR) repeat protein